MFGKTLGDFATATGGAPTLISGSEQYLAYQRGTVDIGMTGVSGVKSRKLWEVMDTITVTNHADIEFLVVVNNDWWNALSDDNRKIIQDAAIVAENNVRDAMSKIEAEAYAAAKENGMTVYEPSAEEIEAFGAPHEPAYLYSRIAEQGIDPFKFGSRPKIRTTDDYLTGKIDPDPKDGGGETS